MSRGGEDEVRHLLDGPHPQVPADLAQRAAERGARLLRRRRFAGRLMLLLTCAVVVAFMVWAVTAQPWQVPPAETTPLDGW
jgi:ferric-dicitrate binding protein FerR (iron transport regulator)